jgi:hypothetical protein
VADCVPCAEPTTSLTLIAAAGPLRPPTAWFQDPGFYPGDPRLVENVDQKTNLPLGKFSCPITITEDGQVFGHIAAWGVYHTDYLQRGRCVLPPRNYSGYSQFHSGSVLTAEGTIVDTGPLTANGRHAGNVLSLRDAQRHYDDTTTRVANVRCGEDDFGIWVAGSIDPSATEAQVFTLRASTLSGDWRPWGSHQELIAGHAVNTPGFPQPKATLRDGRVLSLVAAGVPHYAPDGPSLEERFARLEGVVVPLAVAQLRSRMAALRSA